MRRSATHRAFQRSRNQSKPVSRKFCHLRLRHHLLLIVERERFLGRIGRQDQERQCCQQAASREKHERGENGIDRSLWRDQIVGPGDEGKTHWPGDFSDAVRSLCDTDPTGREPYWKDFGGIRTQHTEAAVVEHRPYGKEHDEGWKPPNLG